MTDGDRDPVIAISLPVVVYIYQIKHHLLYDTTYSPGAARRRTKKMDTKMWIIAMVKDIDSETRLKKIYKFVRMMYFAGREKS